MHKRALLIITIVLSLPSLASAFNCWSVSRSTSPASQAATLIPPANGPTGVGASSYNTVGSITYVTAATGTACATAATSIPFTLTPPAGAVPTVKIDNVIQTPPPAAGPASTAYTVSKGTTISHTISATYATNPTVLITTIPAAGGYIEASQTVPYNGGTDITITPNTGYLITEVTINGSADAAALSYVLANGFYRFANVTTPQSLTASFSPVPTLTAAIATPNSTIVPGVTLNLVGSAIKNLGTIVPTYQWTATPAGATITNPTSPTATFTAPPGTYTVTLTVADAALGLSDDETRTIVVQTTAVYSSSACLGCHSIRDPQLSSAYTESQHYTQTNGADSSCAGCHNPTGSANHPFVPAVANSACVTCHYPGSTKVTSWPPPELSFHNAYNGTNRCAQCHDPHTTLFNGNVPYPHFSTFSSAQYVTAKISCDICHRSAVDNNFNVYSANRQWARSGKANPKSPAFIGSGPYTAANLEASDFKFLGTPLPARPATTTSLDCVRCHTTTGFISYVTPTDSQNPNTAFSDIKAWGTPGDRTREMIACNACHINTSGFDATFSRRSIGIETAPDDFPFVYNVRAWYGYSSAATKKIIRSKAYANPAGTGMFDSNLCIACHTGKAAGDLIKYPGICTPVPSIACRAGETGTFWANVEFIDPHNMNTANLMFPDGLRAGYEYRAGTSASPAHTNIGLDTTQGPCVGCHMSSPRKHSFASLSTASSGVIASIITNRCTTCHGSSAALIDPGILQVKKEGYQAALAVIVAQLAAKGIHYNAAVPPYFFTTADPAQQNFATRTVNWNINDTFQGANLLGAAFNLRLLQPGAGWVHNSPYSKRILYDTIDYLDNGFQDNSAATTIQNIAAAYTYLVPRP